jgi:HK97 gp10 family phage protein
MAVHQMAVRSLHPHLVDLGNELAEAMRDAVSTPCPPHSAPGEAPHKETGELASSFVVSEGKPGEVYVANTAEHAILLEKGTRKMEPRPFIRPTLMRFRRRFARIDLGG